jgi:flagellin-specific chaperone FliS
VVKPEKKEDIELRKIYERILKTLTAVGNQREINKVRETDGFRAVVAS